MNSPDDRVAALRAAISGLPAPDARTRSSCAFALERLDALEAPFDEDADPVHVTASAIVTGAQGVLLHRHKRLGLWLQPGGHLEPDEEPEDAALREVREETGLVAAHPSGGARLVHLDVHPGPKGHTHLDLRYLLHAEGAPSPPDGESQDVAWFSWNEALALADDGLRASLQWLAAVLPAWSGEAGG
ncbi:MAG: NUDIX hydrolase [Egibacteraceae bacterium]